MTSIRRILPEDAAVAFLISRQFTIDYDIETGIFLARNAETPVTMPGHSPVECVHALIKAGYTTALAVESFLHSYLQRRDVPPEPTDPTT